MKKIVLSMLMTFMLLFGIKQVNAKDLNAEINLGETDYFNIFHEFNNQTPLSKFLMEHGYNILDYLIEIAKQNIENWPNDFYSHQPNTVYITKNMGTSEYSIVLLPLYKISLGLVENSYQLQVGYGYILEFDSEMNLKSVEQEFVSTSLNAPKIREKIGALGFWGEKDLTNILSHFYFTVDRSVRIETDYDKINIVTVNQDRAILSFDTFKWSDYLKYIQWTDMGLLLAPGSGLTYYDFQANFDLDYYKKNSFYSKSDTTFKSIGSLLFMEQEFTIPAGYKSFTIDDPTKLHYLTNKGSNGDTNIYYYSTYKDVIFYSSLFSLSETSLDHVKDAVFKVSKSFTSYMIDPKILYERTDLLDTTIMFFRENTKYSSVVYYDPNCYSYMERGIADSSNVTFENENGTYTYSPSRFQQQYQIAINGNKEIEDNNGGSNSGDNGNNSFDFGAGTVLNGFKNFVGSVSGIASSISSFLSNLPSELVQLLYAGFTMGIIAMIIKIIL